MDRRFDEIAEFAEMATSSTSRSNYSSGMVVRLAFSVAIHVDPEICW